MDVDGAGKVHGAAAAAGGVQGPEGVAFCSHGRQRYLGKGGNGGGICSHGRLRYYCKEGNEGGICSRGRQR